MSVLKGLNSEQLKAVTYGNGPLLIVAGAGTGKTTVITQRFIYLIKFKKIKLEEILALTFTEKAAEEMEERVNKFLPDSYFNLWISTFHSFCERILRNHGLDIGLSTDFKLADPTTAWRLIRQNLNRFDLDYYKPLSQPTKFIHALIEHFSRCKDECISPSEYLDYSDKLKMNLDDIPIELTQESKRVKEIANAYHTYQQLLLENNVLDFGDLINYCLKLFKQRPIILKKYQDQFKYILVDEFQDTNWAQYELIKMLAGSRCNLTVCADDDQCLPGDARIQVFENGKIREKPIRNIKKGEQVLTGIGKGHIGISLVNEVFKTKKKVNILTINTEEGYKIKVTDNHKMFCLDLNVDLICPHHCLNTVNRGEKKRLIIINVDMCYRKYRSKEHVRKGKILLNAPIKHQVSLKTSDIKIIQKLKRAGFSFKKLKKGMILKIESEDLWKLGNIAEKLKKITGGLIKVKFNIASKHEKIKNCCQTYNALIVPAKNLTPGHYIPVRKGTEIIYDRIVSIKEKQSKQVVYDLEINKTHNFIANGVVVHNSIYRWRGASVSNVLQFRNDYPQSKEVILINNYRSTQDILDLSYKFIQLNNPNRLEYQLNQIKEISKEAKEKGINLKNFKKFNKKLKAHKKGNALIEHLHFKTLEQEARGVADKIIEIFNKDKRASFNDFVILVRANKEADIFLRALEQSRIPVQFLASKGLYFKPIILDIISYFKLLDDYHESSALYRILNLPFFQISAEEIANISRYSHQKGISIYEALNQVSLINGISQKTVLKINWLLDLIKKHTNLAKKETASEVFISFLEDSGYLRHLTKKSSKGKGEEDLNFINQFYNKIKEFEANQIDPRLSNFIQELKMEIESGEHGSIEFNPELESEAVKIMTIHSAKGLEFEYVFLVNLVDKKFPTIERKELIEIPKKLIKEILPEGDIHLQEERRLFYVGMTRAKKGLFFTSADDYGGIRKKQLSRFLKEIEIKSERKNKGKTKTSFLNLFPKVLKKDYSEIIKDKDKKPQILPSYFSFTQLEAFRNCPLQYKFAHILRIPVKGKNSFSFGKSIHNTLFKFVKLATLRTKIVQRDLFNVQEEKDKKFLQTKDVKPLKFNFKELLKIYQENWINEWYEDEKQEQDFYKLGRKILKNFYNDFIKTSPEILFINNQPALEQDFKLKIDKYFLKGKIDRIDKIGKEIEIIDYKTGTPKKKLKPEDKRQMLIYQLALESLLGIKTPQLTYYYLEDGTKLSFKANEKEKQDFKKELIIEFEKIKNSDFSPTPGWQCSQCDFKDICEYREN